MDLGLKKWNNQLGVVGTIYEEEDETGYNSSSTIPSPEFTPSPTPQFSGIQQRNRDPDVVIHVQDSCFRLHKAVLITKSGYLKRQLNKVSEITLSPPLNITAKTFSLVTDFCYGTFVPITTFNVAALLTAAELLEMTEVNSGLDDNLQQITESYFCRAVAVNIDNISIVFETSLMLLPESETMASLVSRCIQALSLMGEADDEVSFLDGVKRVDISDLQLVLESTSQRLTNCHDLIYRIVDLYLKENSGKVTEDQKTRMCNYIDCSILSPGLLMHAVQNPRMPLRFVVQAMFIEQLNTRRSIISAAADHHIVQKEPANDPITLGAILQRDAALRQVAQLKAVMNTTNSHIVTLEKELDGIRKLLIETEKGKNRIDKERSASSRFSSETGKKIERGQIGSVSALSMRDVRNIQVRAEGSSTSEDSSQGSSVVEKNFGRRFISGLKSAFRFSKKKDESKGNLKMGKNEEKVEKGDGNENIVVIKKDQAFHRRSRSQS